MANARDVVKYSRVQREFERGERRTMRRYAGAVTTWPIDSRYLGDVDVTRIGVVFRGRAGSTAEVILWARRSIEFGASAFDLFLQMDPRTTLDNSNVERAVFFAGTIGFGGEVNGLPMSGEWLKLPGSPNELMPGPMEARYNSPFIFPVRLASLDDVPELESLLSSVDRCDGEPGVDVVVPFYEAGSRSRGLRHLRACPPGSVLNPLGELLDGEWLRIRAVRGQPCAYLELGSYRGTPSRPAGPPGIEGGSSIAIASAAALAATALAVARKGRR